MGRGAAVLVSGATYQLFSSRYQYLVIDPDPQVREGDIDISIPTIELRSMGLYGDRV